MAEPRIKGIFLTGITKVLNKYLELGRTTREALAQRLEPEDVALLDQEISPAGWYSIHSYRRIAELTAELSNVPVDQISYQQGKLDARRMIEAGLYQQLDSLDRLHEDLPQDEDVALERYRRHMRLVLTLSQAVYTFSKWTVEDDPDHSRRVQLRVTDAAMLPDMNVIGTVGFLDECSAAAHPDTPITWTWERPEPDLVLFRMKNDLTG